MNISISLDFFGILFVISIAIIFLILGYWMGRNSAGQPFQAVEKEKLFDPGSTNEPEGDIINDAFYPPPIEGEEEDERISAGL